MHINGITKFQLQAKGQSVCKSW